MIGRTEENFRTVRKRVRKLLKEISQEYDFRQFSLDSFVQWLEQRREQRILFVPWKMHGAVFGAWLTTPDTDYIFYAKDTLPLHQLHIKLHELAHILCGHSTTRVTETEIADLYYTHLAGRVHSGEGLLLRANQPTTIEFEAETLSALIQEQVFHHAKHQALIVGISANQDLGRLYRAWELCQ